MGFEPIIEFYQYKLFKVSLSNIQFRIIDNSIFYFKRVKTYTY